MSLKYDDGQYGVVEQIHFARATFNQSLLAEDKRFTGRWYPGGDIEILKFGVRVATALGSVSPQIRLKKNGTTSATDVIASNAAAFSVASKSLISSGVGATVMRGDYVDIDAATSATGAVMGFLRYRRVFGSTWDADPNA